MTGLGLAVLTSKKGYTPHQASQLRRWIIKHGFTKSVLQSDHDTSLMQLVSTVAADLNFLPESVHLTHIRFKARWGGSIETSLTNFVQQDYSGAKTSTSSHTCYHQSPYPGRYIHSIFILNNYLVHSSEKDIPLREFRYNYRSSIAHFGENCPLEDIRNTPTQKLRFRNQHQKLRSIWFGRDLITDEHILALPLQYSQHPSTTTGAYRYRKITRAPREETTRHSWRAFFSAREHFKQPPEAEHRNKRSTATTTSG